MVHHVQATSSLSVDAGAAAVIEALIAEFTRLEAGTDLRTIQLLMGHAHLEHTTVYLHLSQRHLHAAANPLDQITIRGHGEAQQPPKDDKACRGEASAATMLEIAADPAHLGAEIGFLSILHTWGQTLQRHPHIHCVVPGGGLSPDHAWWIPSQ
jgi:hypothetical protein